MSDHIGKKKQGHRSLGGPTLPEYGPPQDYEITYISPGVDDTPSLPVKHIVDIITTSYSEPLMDTDNAYVIISKASGIPVERLRKLVSDNQKRAAREATQRVKAANRQAKADARATGSKDEWKSPLLPLPEGLKWPTEHFDQSAEYQKKGGIIRHLERVWKPLVTAGVVDMPILRAFYPSTAQGIDNYRHAGVQTRKTGEARELPPDLNIPLGQPGSGRQKAGAQKRAVPG